MSGSRDERLRRLSTERRTLLDRLLRAKAQGRTPPAPPIEPQPGSESVASFAQERFWLLEQLDPGNPGHHIAGVITFTGPLDVDALARAVGCLFERHGALRTRFEVIDGAPRPRPGPAGRMTFVDLADGAVPGVSARMERHSESARRPFDFTADLLVRVELVKWSDDLHEFALCLHHVVADGLSMRLLAGELGTAYTAFHAGTEPRFMDLFVTYDDYAWWQRAWLTDQVLAPAIEWWTNRLAGTPVLDIPFDHERGSAFRRRGARVKRDLDSRYLAPLRALAAREKTTPFVVFLTAWKVLLSRLTGSTDLVVGTPWANRERPEIEGLVGFFVNSLVLRTDLSGDSLTMADAIREVGVTVREAQARAHVPFERLVQALDPDRDLARHPIYQVMFNWVDFGGWDHDLGDDVTAHFTGTPAGVLVDLSLYAHVGDSGIQFELEFDAERMEPETAAGWLTGLETILAGALASMESPVATLSVAPPGYAVARQWTDGPGVPPPVLHPLEAVRRHGLETPATTAVIADAPCSYSDLVARVDEISRALASHGVASGDRVGLALDRDLDLIAAPLAVWDLGAAWVPIDPSMPRVRRDWIADDADVVGVLSGGAAWEGRTVVSGPADTGSDVAYVIYTSGSTGEPKGVVISHGALNNLLASMAAAPGLGADDVLLSVTSATFDIALLEWFLPLSVGACVVIASGDRLRDGRRLAETLEVHPVTVVQGTPATWRMLLDAGWEGAPGLRAWCGGEALPRDLAAALLGRCAEVWNLYGPTETCIWSCAWRVVDGPVSIGRPIHRTTVRVVDAEGRDVPPSFPGELWIGGAGVADGYWRREELTRDRFVSRDGERFHRTGDVVRWRRDGFLECLGRLDEQIKVRGHRIEPGEVEVALRSQPGVKDAAVGARPDPSGTSRLIAWVVPDSGATADGSADVRVADWAEIWNESYRGSAATDPAFDISGWRSVIDGAPLSPEVMSNWLTGTVERIREFGARRVLEIGCGTGLVTVRCAGETDRWVACDVAAESVARVGEIASAREWAHVDVVAADARALGAVAAGETFDAVIINSVVQYLPDAPALEQVIDQALDRLDQDGVLYLGDLRDRGLLAAQALWAETQATGDPESSERVLTGVARRLGEERELAVDRALADVLAEDHRVASARAMARHRSGNDELSRFRFDLVIRRGPVQAVEHQGDGRFPGLAGHVNDPMRAERDRSLVTRLRRVLSDLLPAALVPDLMMTIDGLPLTASGKVDRRALPDPTGASQPTAPPTPGGRVVAEPTTDTEKKVAAAWAACLGTSVGIHDDWFEVGGHSLLATRLLAGLGATIGIDVPLRVLFEGPTVARLASWIDEEAAPAEQIPASERQVPSFGQERLAFLDRLAPRDGAYLMSAAFRLTGPLQVDALDRALRDAVARHPSLRTSLPIVEGHVAVEIEDSSVAGIVVEDVVEGDVAALVEQEIHRGFDLSRAPLWRARLLRHGERTATLILVVHHGIADAWSVGVLTRELAELYAGHVAGVPTTLDALPISPTDWAAWQRARADDPETEEDVAWWGRALAELPLPLDLLPGRSRPAVQDRRGGQRRFVLAAGEVERLDRLARADAASRFEVIASAVSVLLGRLSGADEVVVGTSVAQRGRRETKNLMGFLVNTIPLRLGVAWDGSWGEHVHDVKERVRAALAHGDVPFERIVDAVDPDRDLSRAPLFQMAVDLVELPPPPALPEVTVEDLDVLPRTSKFDLGWRFEQRGSDLSCVVEWSSALFDDRAIASWWGWFLRVLERAAEEPDEALGDLGCASDSEERAREAWCAGQDKPYPVGATLHGLMVEVAQRHPDAVAIIDDDAVVSFARLMEMAAAVGASLLARGVEIGDRVAVHGRPSAPVLAGLLGVLRAGAAYVPIDPDLPDERRAFLVADAECRWVLSDEMSGPSVVAFDDVLGAESVDVGWPEVAAESPAYVLYTSGSTGQPKGVVVPHRAVVHYGHWAVETYLSAAGGTSESGGSSSQGTSRPRGGAPLHTSLGFDLSVTSFIVPWLAGRPVTLVSSLEEALREGGFDLVKLTPSHLAALPADLAAARATRVLVVGGEALTPEVVRPWVEAGVRVVNEYGPTEATVGCVAHEVTAAEGPVPIGRPIDRTHLRIVDVADYDVPPGCPGELVVSGPGVALGYLGRRRETQRSFEHGARSWYRTGDRVRFDADGSLLFLGRLDAQVKIRGVRVEPGEVEAVLRSHPLVRDVCVTARDGVGGARLVAHVVARAAPEELRSHAMARLPAAAIPSFIIPLEVLPLTPNGKIDRALLPDPTRARVQDAPAAPPRDEKEATLVDLVSEVLDLDTIGVLDGFFEFGGDSILALELVSRARERGLFLEVRDVFESPRIADLAAVAKEVEEDSIPQQPYVGRVPLSPIQRWWTRLPLVDRHRWHQGVALDLAEGADRRLMAGALGAVVAQHDLLRATLDEESSCLVVTEPPLHASPIEVTPHAPDEIPAIDPSSGPLLRATWADGPGGPRLSLYVHHLVVDAVSWRILIEDLVRAYGAAESGAQPEFPRRTSAFADALSPSAPEIAGGTGDGGCESEAKVVERTLDDDLSALVLDRAHAALRTGPQDLLVAALGRALGDGLDGSVTIDVEGHGRDEAVGDVSRTVGWFTVLKPIDAPVAGASVAAVRVVKESLRAPRVARTGAASALFNWLGRTRSEGRGIVARVTPLFALRGGANPRTHGVECDAREVDGSVVIRLACRGEAAPLLDRMARALHDLGSDLETAQRMLTPSDVPLANVRQSTLDAIVGADPAVSEIYPLTATQQGMALHALYEPGSPAYVEQLVTVISGALDHTALRRAYEAIVGSYDLFRGAVCWRGVDRPQWLIRDHIELPWLTESLPAGEGTEQSRIGSLARQDRERGFDLETGPLVRCTLVELDGDRAALLLTWHHATLDGWSLPLVLHRVYGYYSAYERGEDPELTPFAPFREYVTWLSQQDDGEGAAWFREHLGGFVAPVRCDLRAGPQSREEGETEVILDDARSRHLADGARDLGVTLGTLIRAAWGLLLARMTSRDDVVFGITVAGRPPALRDVAQRVGCFVNTLPIRVCLENSGARGEWIRDLQRTFAEASRFEHTPLSLSQAQADVQPGTPLFDTLVVIENYPVQEALDELRAKAGAVTTPWTQVWGVEGTAEAGALVIDDARGFERTSYGLTLVAVPADRLLLRLVWGDGCADTAGARATLERLVEMMAAFVEAPAEELDEIPTIIEQEARDLGRLEEGPPATPWSGPLHQTIDGLLGAHPEATAILHDDQTTSARALRVRVHGVAHWLRERGVVPGDVVACVLPRGADWIVAMLACWEAGAVWMPVDPDLPSLRRAVMDEVAGPRLTIESLDGVASAMEPVGVAIEETDPAYLLFTSGSTGEPKAVVVSHGSIAAYGRSAADRFGVTSEDRVLHFAALGFDTGLEEVLSALLGGAAVVARTEGMLAGIPAFLREVGRLGISVLDLPTAFWHGLVVGLGDDVVLPDCVRLVVLGGEAVRPDAVARWRGCVPDEVELLNTYGPTEGTIVATWHAITTTEEVVPIGLPVPGAVVRVLDRRGHRVPRGVVGELCIGGRGVALGYRGDEEASAAAFFDHEGKRFYRTGDRASWRDDGVLAFHGRCDRQVKVRGQRVETAEVERTLRGHAMVEDAVVDARPGPTGLILRAWVVVADGDGTAIDGLRSWLGERLPSAMVPATVECIDALPIGPGGKVDRGALSDPRLDTAPPADVAPSELEGALIAAFEATFGVRGLTRDADFFELGGDSLTAVRLMTHLEETGVRPPFRALLEAATPAGIARATEAAPGARDSADLASHRLVAAATLDEDITPVHPAPAAGRPSWCALVTGATGFLGAYLIRELLDRTDAEVIALVRAGDEGEANQRLRAHLEAYGAWGVRAEGRVRAVVGDLAAPRLGLGDQVWDELAEGVDTIWHSGAVADFLRPFEHLEAANVGGTREVLRLAVTARTKTVHHISTIGVFDVMDATGRGPIAEQSDLLEFADVMGGYAQTKWVAERLIQEAASRGVPTTIHRPGRLVADTRSGALNADDLAARLMAACLEIGCVPDVDGPIDATPVDFAAAAIVALGSAPEGRGRISHVMNPQPVMLADLIVWLRERRPEMRVATASGWRDALMAAAGEDRVAALAPLFAFASDEAHGGEAAKESISVSCAASQERWEAAGITCEPIDPEFVARVLQRLDPRDED